MFRRRAYLTVVAGIVGGLAGCTSVENPEDADESGDREEPDNDDSQSQSVTVGIDELLRWLPAETDRPRFRSYELMATDDEITGDRPVIGGEPALATLEFTDFGDDEAASAPAVYFLERVPETDGGWTAHETDSYAVAIEAPLDEQTLTDAYEGAADRLTDVNEDVEIAYDGVEPDYETVCTADPDAAYATATVSSTDGETGQLAVVFESEPTDSDLDAVREDEPTVDGIVGTGDRLVVFEYAVPES